MQGICVTYMMKSIIENGTLTIFMLNFENILFVYETPKVIKFIDSFLTLFS